MTRNGLIAIYRDYLDCLNRRDWAGLACFVDDAVTYNDRQVGLSGYREMLQRDVTEIPDLAFNSQLLVSDPPFIACRLDFHCTPRGRFLGLDAGGTRISFSENVFYEFAQGRIARVWSVIDKAAIEAQL